MDKTTLIENTKAFVKQSLQAAEGGHDYWHACRVWKTAKHIAQYENADILIVELGAWLHDIADAKFHNDNENKGAQVAHEFLVAQKVDGNVRHEVMQIVKNVSFKGGNVGGDYHSIELNIVQDADRLDALGAIGIARAFNYGGYKGRSLYNPAIAPKLNMTPEEYRTHKAPTINHFYEKLLRLSDNMHTLTAKALAQERHKFMELFLEQFYKEWDANY